MGLTTLQILAGIFHPHPQKGEKPENFSEVVVRNLYGVISGSSQAILGSIAQADRCCYFCAGSVTNAKGSQTVTKDYLVPIWFWIFLLFNCLLVLKIFAFRKWSKASLSSTTVNKNEDFDPNLAKNIGNLL
jgi:hypothetical protein